MVAMSREFAEDRPQLLVLHGDYHHDNVLAATRVPWLVIDPKGVVGEAAADIGQFLLNPWLNPRPRMIERRLEIFAAELRMDRQRLRSWAGVRILLSAAWNAEGGSDWRSHVAMAAAVLNIDPS
jgi:streptomycin 6-kinase